MEKYYFLFGLAFAWMVFAAVYDLKKREVPNWLNFSLIGFALAYRAFYSASFSEWMFLAWGLTGFGIFVALGNLFYYGRVFAGGDAKLLMGLGAVLPFESWSDFASVGFGFILVVLMIGAAYSLGFTILIANKNYQKFRKEFAINWRKGRVIFLFAGILAAVLLVLAVSLGIGFDLWLVVSAFFFLISFLYIYLNAVDKCMVKLVSPNELTEGDWIIGDIRLKDYVVKKTVHGLSLKDILRLRKAGKKVLIKEGIPFVPVILIAFAVMVFFLAVSGFDFLNLVSFLS